MKRKDWSDSEVAITIADYLDMLRAEQADIPYSKAAHRRGLMGRLDGRSEGAIEFKYANVSSALVELGMPYIAGYQPRSHRQAKLVDELRRQIARQSASDELGGQIAD